MLEAPCENPAVGGLRKQIEARYASIPAKFEDSNFLRATDHWLWGLSGVEGNVQLWIEPMKASHKLLTQTAAREVWGPLWRSLGQKVPMTKSPNALAPSHNLYYTHENSIPFLHRDLAAAHDVHAYEMHANEVHAHNVHTSEVHAHEMHACGYTPTRYTPTGNTPTRYTSMRHPPMKHTPMRCTSMRYTLMRCTLMRCGARP
jgi:hypothetical protein